MFRLSDQDVILPITSIEWGSPDRWSFTSRYVHELDKDKEDREWHHSLSVAFSPGISGGRFGIGYLLLYDPKSSSDFGIFGEARTVLLRTWGNPLATDPDITFIGAEIRTAISFLLNLGVGYYKPIPDSDGDNEGFFGFHVGVGI